jgi:hypothetical protein
MTVERRGDCLAWLDPLRDGKHVCYLGDQGDHPLAAASGANAGRRSVDGDHPLEDFCGYDETCFLAPINSHKTAMRTATPLLT